MVCKDCEEERIAYEASYNKGKKWCWHCYHHLKKNEEWIDECGKCGKQRPIDYGSYRY